MRLELIKVRIVRNIFVLIWTRFQIFDQSKPLVTFMSVAASGLRPSRFRNRLVE